MGGVVVVGVGVGSVLGGVGAVLVGVGVVLGGVVECWVVWGGVG